MFLRDQFSSFRASDFDPRRELYGVLLSALAWVIPAVFLVIATEKYAPDSIYLNSAVQEGLGPNLWNLIGSFGLLMFGLAIAFSNEDWPRKVAKKILVSTFAMGNLALGLLIGQFMTSFTMPLLWWQYGLYGVTSGFLLLTVLLMNLFIWYLSFLLENLEGEKSSFLIKISQIHFVWKVLIGLGLSIIVIILNILQING